MAISFRCECNRTLKVADQHAGKRVRCPGCNGTPTVPQLAAVADTGFDVVDDEDDAPPPPKRAAVAKAVAKPAKVAEDSGFEVVDDDDDLPKKKPKKSAKYDHGDDDEDDTPRRKTKRKGKKALAKAKPNGAKRMLYIVGGALALIIGCGIAYYAWNSDMLRPGRLIGLGVTIAFFGVGGMYNGATGNIESDDDDSSDWDSDD